VRAFFACLVAFLASACAPAPPASPSHSALAEELAGKTVALVGGANNDRAYCSGVWVAPDAILTAAHCVEDLEGSTVHYSTREDVVHLGDLELVNTRVAVVEATDDAHDLALLRAQFPGTMTPHGVASVSSGPLNPGDAVYTMGQPHGLWWSYSSGEIAAIRFIDAPPAIWYVQTTAPISPGSSGCGLFDASGRIVGIAHGSYSGARNQLLNFFVHREYVTHFLKGRV
jgi:S1-C subfamily serine protease